MRKLETAVAWNEAARTGTARVTLAAVLVLASVASAAAQRSITLVVRTDPDLATVSQAGKPLGTSPVKVKYKTTKEFRASKNCLPIQPITATWASGASTEMQEHELCPHRGVGVQYEIVLRRPNVSGREIDDLVVLKAQRDAEAAEAAREAARRARWQALAGALQAFSEGYSAGLTSNVAPNSSTRLLLFGGPGHKTYLGCLSCSEFDAESVFNSFGSYGSKFSSSSIFNRFSDFGSKFSSYSACNQFASDPPVIVDPAGNFYGRLTISATNPERTRSTRWQGWIAGVCAGE